jgi:protein-S-isoprenylcysteine O-methyltransferase Ste14
MDTNNSPAYGLWILVILNAAIFIGFAFSFTRPRTARDWRSFGAFTAFIVALFTEMYGFPLTIYLLSGWLARRYPDLDLFSHNAGHLWETLLGVKGDPHFSGLHILSNILLIGGMLLLIRSWQVLYQAQVAGQLATSGTYAYVRHPQYVAFGLMMLGFLVQWPTLITLIMFPVLVTMYVKLAHKEEQEALARFPEAYASYIAATPAFFPYSARQKDGETMPAPAPIMQPPTQTVPPSDNYQEVQVLVKAGYTPDVIRAERGKRLRLNFVLAESSACSEQVLFPDFDRKVFLLEGRSVPIDLMPDEAGEFEFRCQMGILHGKLIVV